MAFAELLIEQVDGFTRENRPVFHETSDVGVMPAGVQGDEAWHGMAGRGGPGLECVIPSDVKPDHSIRSMAFDPFGQGVHIADGCQ